MKIKNLKPKELAENLKSEGIKTVSAINENRKPFLLVVIIALVLMFSICWITFFATGRAGYGSKCGRKGTYNGSP